MKIVFRLLKLGLFLWGATFLALCAMILVWQDDQSLPEPADAIICLGAGMSLDGWEIPDSASARRAQTCAELYQSGVAPLVVTTGHGNERYSAAEAMADIVRASGVPDDAVLVETEAMSTIQNAAFSLPMLPDGTDRIVLVSDAFHLPRSWLIFRGLGAPNTALFRAGPTEGERNGRSMLWWVAREVNAIWFNVGRAATYIGAGLMGIPEDTRIGWFN